MPRTPFKICHLHLCSQKIDSWRFKIGRTFLVATDWNRLKMNIDLEIVAQLWKPQPVMPQTGEHKYHTSYTSTTHLHLFLFLNLSFTAYSQLQLDKPPTLKHLWNALILDQTYWLHLDFPSAILKISQYFQPNVFRLESKRCMHLRNNKHFISKMLCLKHWQNSS